MQMRILRTGTCTYVLYLRKQSAAWYRSFLFLNPTQITYSRHHLQTLTNTPNIYIYYTYLYLLGRLNTHVQIYRVFHEETGTILWVVIHGGLYLQLINVMEFVHAQVSRYCILGGGSFSGSQDSGSVAHCPLFLYIYSSRPLSIPAPLSRATEPLSIAFFIWPGSVPFDDI